MSDSDEAADGKALAYEEAALLHAKKPDHPLLKYVLRPDSDSVWDEFVAKFGKPGLSREAQRAYPAVAYMFAKYWVALREANQDPEKEIVVSHDPVPVKRRTGEVVQAQVKPLDLEDDLPF